MDVVEVHPLSSDPTSAWEAMRKTQTVLRLKFSQPRESVASHQLRLVCLSDTHSLMSHMRHRVPDGDVLIHAGDFSHKGSVEEIEVFDAWLASLPHKHKIVIAGNHELTFDPSLKTNSQEQKLSVLLTPRSSHEAAGLNALRFSLSNEQSTVLRSAPHTLNNCIYLQDSGILLCGLNIWGSPWQPTFRSKMAFSLERGQSLLSKWQLIPDNTDILITHTPPVGFGDASVWGQRAGCVELLSSVQKRVRPKIHVYGHIHEGHGVRSDGRTCFINASICNANFEPRHRPIVVDVDLPNGHQRQELNDTPIKL